MMCLAASALLLASSLAAFTVDEKLTLEQSLAHRATDILENIVGKGRVMTFVDVELGTTQSQREKETYNMPTVDRKAARWMWDEIKETRKFILPGYPTKEGGETGGSSAGVSGIPGKMERISEQQYDLPQTVIKRMSVTVMIDLTVKDELLKNVPNVVASVLNMNRDRGDTINLHKMPFPAPPGLIDEFRKPELIVDISKFVAITILGIIAIVMFFLLLRLFLRDFSQMAQAVRLKMQEESKHLQDGSKHKIMIEGKMGRTGLDASPDTGRRMLSSGDGSPLDGLPPAAGTAEDRHFGFISEGNLGRLAFILRNEAPDNIAITLSYLTPKDTAFVLASLDPAKRTEVTNRLSSIFETDPQHVIDWEKTVEKKINYILGGADLLTEVIDLADDRTREQLLADIATRTPDLAVELRNGLFLFENITFLDDKEMKLLLSRIDNDQLALALQEAPQEIVEKVFNNKGQGAQNILKETLDLMGRQPQKRVIAARQYIVAVARQLIKEGYITPKKPKRVDAYVVE